jgi:D-arabinose 1-dehydrogenase-like Zn-dependent alcohol dehydrogenase
MRHGRAKVNLMPEQLLEVLAQPANYSIQHTTSGGYSEAVFVDAQAGARAPHGHRRFSVATVCAQCTL